MNTRPETNGLLRDSFFQPKSIAVAGVSKHPENPGNTFFRQLKTFPFKGIVYPISKKEDTIFDTPCYRSLQDISGPVDHVISCVPHHQLLSLVDDCIAKQVRTLHLYTARLAETGLKDRFDLEKQLIKKARKAGIRVVGPNCMGLYNPEIGLTFRFNLPKDAGSIAFISQSGGNVADLEYLGVGRGLRFSKIVSFGNGADLNESDFLDYFIQDPQTRIIAMYLEGVKQGRRFIDLLKKAQGKKPIILYKAGGTKAGSRAVRSHTASMSGDLILWKSLCRQFGLISVESMEEMTDVLLAFQYLPPSSGRRILVMGGGGGGSVAAADLCEQAGFEVPPLPPEITAEIKLFAPDVWSLISNPMDSSAMGSPQTRIQCYQLGIRWDGADIIIGNTSAAWLLDHHDHADIHKKNSDLLIQSAKEVHKPMVLFISNGDSPADWRMDAVKESGQQCRLAEVPVYPSLKRAVYALARFTGYYRSVEKGDQPFGT